MSGLTDLNAYERWAYDREYIFARLSGCVAGGVDLAANQISLGNGDQSLSNMNLGLLKIPI